MATKTWYLTNPLGGRSQQALSETSPGADATSGPNYGWTVGTTAAGNYASADAESEVTGFSTTIQPDGIIVTTAGTGDCWRTEFPYNGSFAAGNWTFQMAVIAVTAGGAMDGNAGFRLFRSSDADGSSATEITGGSLEGSTVTNLDVGAQQTSIHNSTSLNAFTLTDEYLFVQVGWEITGAGSKATHDCIHRVGTTASLITSTDFTSTVGVSGPRGSITFTSVAPGVVPWTTPGSAKLADSDAAAAVLTTLDETTEFLRGTTWGFGLAASDTVDGIRVQIERQASVAANTQDYSMRILQGGSPAGTDLAAFGVNWPTVLAFATYGGATEKWGLTWTAADINSTGLGAQLAAINTGGTSSTLAVDFMIITVYYTTAAGTKKFMMLGVG